MENTGTNAQPEEYLYALLEVLACPVDPSGPLSAVRDGDGRIVALRSRSGEYPVVGNVPCMIPDLAELAGRHLRLWQKHQQRTWQDYQRGEGGFLPEDYPLSLHVGEIIQESTSGLVLDIGCGVLPFLGYMATSGDRVRWMGIDPLLGDAVRRFPFAQALAEYLPFRPHAFDGVLCASVLSHQADPLLALQRTRSALEPQGRLYIWYEPPKGNARYVFWKLRQALGLACQFNKWHRWAFTERSLRSLLGRAGFAVERIVLLCERCPDYPTCRQPGEYLVIARSA